ncbi:23157_t:CDS:2 [Rhizophagus irregularis]|nr:23157_t:CDS:2 [Rhizophagus irregularis]
MAKFTKLTFVCVLVLVLLVSFSVSSPAAGPSGSSSPAATGAAYKIESGLSSVVALAALVGYFL